MQFLNIFHNIGANVTYNIIASLVWAAFLLLYNIIKKNKYKRTLKKSARIKIKSNDQKLKIECFYANSGKEDQEESVLLGYPFEYMASATLSAYLSIITKEQYEMSSYPSPIAYRDAMKEHTNHLLLLGGPFHNNITSRIFGLEKGHTNLPFYFDEYQYNENESEAATLFYEGNADGKQQVFVPKRNGTGDYYKDDYGLIINLPNPYNTEKRLIGIIGCRSIGVLGAAKYFTEKSEELSKSVKKYDNYAVVISCHGDKFNVDTSNIQQVLAIPIDEIREEQLFDSKE